jgi:hypothetical protein
MKTRKNRTKTALMTIALASASVAQVARAGFTVNDLYLGFTQSSAQSDYIIDLGQPSTVGVGGSTVVDLSSDFSFATFNSIFTGGPVGVTVAVVGGDNVFGQFAVYTTQPRTGGAGDPTIPGSSISATHSTSQMSGGASQVAAIMSSTVNGLPTAGNSAVDSTKSYTAIVNTPGVQNNFPGKTGVNPSGLIDNTGIVYEDLYSATTANPYTYLGYIAFDATEGTLTFTPAAAPVPEPSTSALLGTGLLTLMLRRQFKSKAHP